MQKILVVDDDDMMRDVITQALSDEFVITNAKNGLDASELLSNQDFDLVITDLVMPEMNGIELLMDLQRNHPDQKLIAISGGGGIQGRFDYLPVAKLIGACMILRKPFQLSELRNSVRQVLQPPAV